MGRFFKKKQIILTKFQLLATLGRHIYAVITDRRKFNLRVTQIARTST